MGSLGKYFRIIVKILAVSFIAALLIALRYVLSIPQAMESVFPGKDCLYKWLHGSIFYKVLGPADAPPLLLVHAPEIGASSYEMRNLVDGLARRYRVYVLDLPGFGLSDRPNIAYSSLMYSSLLRDFLKDVVARPTVVIASGLSCNYALALADSESALCERLILLAPEAAFVQKNLSRSLLWLIGLPTFALLSYAFLTSRFVLRWVIARQRGLSPQQVASGELDYLFASAHQPGAHHIWKASMSGKLSQLDVPPLTRLRQPMLIIQGSQAARISVHFAAQACVVTIPDSGLRIHEECPAKVVKAIVEWLVPDLDQLVSTRIATANHTDPLLVDGLLPLFEHENSDSKEPAVLTRSIEADTLQIQQESEPLENPSNVTEVTQVEAYCVKCRKKNTMQSVRRIVTKNGRSALEGVCPICGTKLFRFVSS